MKTILFLEMQKIQKFTKQAMVSFSNNDYSSKWNIWRNVKQTFGMNELTMNLLRKKTHVECQLFEEVRNSTGISDFESGARIDQD